MPITTAEVPRGGHGLRTFAKNVVVRSATGFAQLVVVLYLASELSVEGLGLFNLLVIFTDYARQIAGFTFHVYLTREMSTRGSQTWPRLLQQQWYFQFVSASVVLPLSGLIFFFDLLPGSLAWSFYIVVILGLYNAHLENYLVGAGQSYSAALNVLLRRGWIFPLATIGLTTDWAPTLNQVLICWIAGETLAVISSSLRIWRLGLFPRGWSALDRLWILRGVKTGARYTIAAVFLLVTLSVNRIVLGATHGPAEVGVLYFYYAIAMAIPNLLETALVVVYLPEILKLGQTGKIMELRRLLGWVAIILFGCSSIFLSILVFLLPNLVALLDQPELLKYIHLGWVGAIAALLYIGYRIIHYYLYALGKDSSLMAAGALSACCAVLAGIFLIPTWGLEGAALALLFTNLVLLIIHFAPAKNARE